MVFCQWLKNPQELQHIPQSLDNIFTNNTTVSSKSGLIVSDISDHLPIFSIVFGDYFRKDSNSFTIRDTSEIRVNEFRHKLENTNWDFSDQANNANDPNTAYNIFIDKYTGLFPFKTIRGKALNSLRKPWLTKSLLSTYIIMTLYLLLLLKSFKLEIRFINTQQDTLTFTDLIPVEHISKNFRSFFKVVEYGIHYRTTSKTPRLIIYSSVWSNHF